MTAEGQGSGDVNAENKQYVNNRINPPSGEIFHTGIEPLYNDYMFVTNVEFAHLIARRSALSQTIQSLFEKNQSSYISKFNGESFLNWNLLVAHSFDTLLQSSIIHDNVVMLFKWTLTVGEGENGEVLFEKD